MAIYQKNYDAHCAADQGLKFVAKTPKGLEGCIRLSYPTYRKSFDGPYALAQSRKSCGQ